MYRKNIETLKSDSLVIKQREIVNSVSLKHKNSRHIFGNSQDQEQLIRYDLNQHTHHVQFDRPLTEQSFVTRTRPLKTKSKINNSVAQDIMDTIGEDTTKAASTFDHITIKSHLSRAKQNRIKSATGRILNQGPFKIKIDQITKENSNDAAFYEQIIDQNQPRITDSRNRRAKVSQSLVQARSGGLGGISRAVSQNSPNRYKTIENPTSNLQMTVNDTTSFRRSTEGGSTLLKNPNQITIDQVTPELAAQIVKQYILPMFDDSKRDSKKKFKQKGITTIKSPKNTKVLPQIYKSDVSNQQMIQNSQCGTVLGDLKLTETLYNELSNLRSKFFDQEDRLTQAEQEREKLKRQLRFCQTKLISQKKSINVVRSQLQTQSKVGRAFEEQVSTLNYQYEQLMQVSLVSEGLRKKFSEQLRYSAGKLEVCQNQIFNQKMREEIFQHSIVFMQDQFKILFNSIENVSIYQKRGEELNQEIQHLKRDQKELRDNVQDYRFSITTLQTERDTFREETKDLNELRIKITMEKNIVQMASKEKITRMESKIKLLEGEVEKLTDYCQKQEKQIKTIIDEREKLKVRIIKLAARKGTGKEGIKTCKNCTKEFNEKENFNWSCRMHQSDWGGEMWWCCGKRGKDQPGCRFSKHESKDDEIDDDDQNKQANIEKMQKNVRCVCCKEIGHRIENCPRDPNFKTNKEADIDLQRMQKIKDYRKLHADTIVNTTHFIKKSVMVPIKEDDEGNQSEPHNTTHPFMRGIMKFDDYNYKQFNSYVLIEEPVDPEKVREFVQDRQLLTKGSTSSKEMIRTVNKPLTDKALDEKEETEKQYVHEAISLDPSEFELEKAAAAELSSGTDQEQETEKKQQQFQDQLAIDKASDDSNGDGDDEKDKQPDKKNSAAEEEFIFKIFFKENEIKATKEAQERDVFEDVLSLRDEAIRSAGNQSKINIATFAPKRVETTEVIDKKKKRLIRASDQEDGQILDVNSPNELVNASSQGSFLKEKEEEPFKVVEIDPFKRLELEQLRIEIGQLIIKKEKSSPPRSRSSSQKPTVSLEQTMKESVKQKNSKDSK